MTRAKFRPRPRSGPESSFTNRAGLPAPVGSPGNRKGEERTERHGQSLREFHATPPLCLARVLRSEPLNRTPLFPTSAPPIGGHLLTYLRGMSISPTRGRGSYSIVRSPHTLAEMIPNRPEGVQDSCVASLRSDSWHLATSTLTTIGGLSSRPSSFSSSCRRLVALPTCCGEIPRFWTQGSSRGSC